MSSLQQIPRPPWGAEWLLLRCLGASDITRSILGDLSEDCGRLARRRGALTAYFWYWRQALVLACSLGLSDRRQRRQPLSSLVVAEIKGESVSDLLRPSAWISDAKYALRAVRKDPRLFLFAVPIVGLGIGACTAVFSVLSPLMLRQLPLTEAERLVWIANDGVGGMSAVTSRTSNLRDFRDRTQSFTAITGYNAFFEHRSYNLVGEGEPERLVGAAVAQDFLQVLGVQPLHGRAFVLEEGADNGPPVVILSHALWQRRFAADPAVVGSTISFSNGPLEVVGVLPPSFDFASIFTPSTRVDFLHVFPISDQTDRWGNTLSMIGRLAPGATVASAQAELDAVLAALKKDDPERWGLGAKVSSLKGQIAGPFRSAMLLLAAAAGAVMLIVCVNLSNLLLASSTKRSREMAVRSALGASRWRLLRQLLIESSLLATAGAGVGLLLAVSITEFAASDNALSIPLLRSVSVDGGALLFTTALTFVVGLAAGLVPPCRFPTAVRQLPSKARAGD